MVKKKIGDGFRERPGEAELLKVGTSGNDVLVPKKMKEATDWIEKIIGLDKNHPIHIQGSAFAFINKLAVSPDQTELFELTPAELSSITPHMRFFKVESGPGGKDIEQEIKFDSR